MQLTFLGAAKEVTGSAFLLTIDNWHLMIDCGLFQGGKEADQKNHQEFTEAGNITALLVTHAHLDHVGRIPRLYRDGFRGNIITHHATADLMRLVLEDQEQLLHHRPTDTEPLFTEADLEASLQLIKRVNYKETVDLGPCLATFHDAGHILGSAWIEIVIKQNGKRLIFSGDLGNPPVPLLNLPEQPEAADYLILESTYGDTVHEKSEVRKEKLRQIIIETVKNKGVLLLPSFAVERAQEILFELDELTRQDRLPQLPVYLDSPLAINVLAVFKRYIPLMNPEAKKLSASGEDFFSFPDLTLSRTKEQSKLINAIPAPKMIIAGGGMMQGGRIIHHAKQYLHFKETRLVFMGFQAHGTLGRRLFDHRNDDAVLYINLNGDDIPVHAQISAIGAYSAHADQPKLLSFIQGMNHKPKGIFLTHGEPESMASLAEAIEQRFTSRVVLPERGETITLD